MAYVPKRFGYDQSITTVCCWVPFTTISTRSSTREPKAGMWCQLRLKMTVYITKMLRLRSWKSRADHTWHFMLCLQGKDGLQSLQYHLLFPRTFPLFGFEIVIASCGFYSFPLYHPLYHYNVADFYAISIF